MRFRFDESETAPLMNIICRSIARDWHKRIRFIVAKKKRVKDLIIESSQIQLLRRLQPRHSKIQIKHFSTSSREQLKYPLKHSRQLTRLTRWHFPQWRNFELINFIHSRNLFGLRLYRVRLNVEKMQSCWLKFQFFARSQRKTLRNHIKHFSYCHLSNCSLFRNHVFGFN